MRRSQAAYGQVPIRADESAGALIDLFVEAPLDFGPAYEAAAAMDVAPGVTATFVGLEDLLRLKRRAGRVQDTLDIENLEAIRPDEGRKGP